MSTLHDAPWVVAVNRDRDLYQVPLALAEAGRLHALVTDLYASPWLSRVAPPVAHRRVDGVPAAASRSSLRAVLAQAVGIAWLNRTEPTLDLVHRLLGINARRVARRSQADLLLYAQCALEAFTDPALRHRRRVLFAFHPHRRLVEHVLLQDVAAFPQVPWTVRETETTAAFARREDAELAAADLVLCASRFTQRSLLEAGVDPARIRVVPYGAPTPANAEALRAAASPPAPCRFLFVGQGVQRKGLHHLLAVWKRLALPNASLTIVCYRLDPALRPLIDATDSNVKFLPGASRDQLNALYASAHVFVMPSLAEGFGLVFPEAMAAGCYVIATENTGVPDLAAPPGLATVVVAGDLDQLAAAISAAHRRHFDCGLPHHQILAFARQASWAAFRQRLRAAIDAPPM